MLPLEENSLSPTSLLKGGRSGSEKQQTNRQILKAIRKVLIHKLSENPGD